MNFLSLYISYIKMYFKARMEYKISFISGIFANFYSYFITYATFWIIIKKFGGISDWNFEDMTMLYGLNLFTYSIAGILMFSVFNIENEITTGNLDIYLIHPMGVIKQMVCKGFRDTFLGQILVTLIFVICTILKLHETLNIFNYIYLVFAILGGILIQIGAMIIFGSISFWILRSRDLADIVYYEFRNFIHYPLTIFPFFIRGVLSFILPWAFINYYPCIIFLNKVQSLEDLMLGLSTPVVGLLFFFLSIIIFNLGLRRYSGSGS